VHKDAVFVESNGIAGEFSTIYNQIVSSLQAGIYSQSMQNISMGRVNRAKISDVSVPGG